MKLDEFLKMMKESLAELDHDSRPYEAHLGVQLSPEGEVVNYASLSIRSASVEKSPASRQSP